ncbi:insulinase family protein [Arthrobacter sp. I2-34]|uniref:Insulinase family protein n=1 Tax=Arthrobacter hankyongi TaxID=2904801 RepID=A0ABS9L8Z2_9MICC|nr:insulinase family protein [Arthrobacter hankyongi]MCG2622934.1 insulinase family protein [Arthrobacter hankyongi]
MTIHSAVVDGVPVRWTEQPGRFAASLVFRCGVRDETFGTAGITHLVEHLAFAAIPVPDHEFNGQVALGITEFTFEGAPGEVARSLAAVCGSLSALAEGRIDEPMLARERAVLEAEGRTTPIPAEIAEALSNHYGLAGPGLAAVEEKYLDRLTAADVSRHAAEYFTRGNAVLVCTAAPPAGLRLPLPEGPRRPLRAAARVVARGPAEYASGGTQLVLSFQVPGDQDDTAGIAPLVCRTLERRIHEGLRRRDGLVYGAACSGVTVDDHSGLMVATIDVAPRNAAEAAGRVIDELRSLRDAGISPEEARRAAVRLASDRAEPGAEQDDAYQTAVAELCGQRPWRWDDVAAAVRNYTPALTASLLADLDSTLLVGLPAEAIPEDVDARTGVVFPPRRTEEKTHVQGRTYKRGLMARFAGVPEDTRLVVGEEGLVLTLLGETTAMPWEAIVGLEREPIAGGAEGITLYTRDAFQLGFVSAWFRRGDDAVTQIRSAVPERLQCIASPGAIENPRGSSHATS